MTLTWTARSLLTVKTPHTLPASATTLPPKFTTDSDDLHWDVSVVRTPSVVAMAAVVAVVAAMALSDVPMSTTRTLIDGCIDHIAFKSAGRCVARLQVELNRRADAGLVPDGQFGEQTLAAVKTYQARRGLRPDGIVGSGTRERLRLERPHLDVSVPPGI